MPSAKVLSPKDIQEIIAARGKESPALVPQHFGTGTTKLYRIWKEAEAAEVEPKKTVSDPVNNGPTQSKTDSTEQKSMVAKAEPKKTVSNPVKTDLTEQINALLNQVLANQRALQKDMRLLMEAQESHFEDVEVVGSGLQELEAEVGETREGILESIEKNSNAVREKTDKIVDAANATTSAVVGVLQVAAITIGITVSLFTLYKALLPKYEKWKQESAAPPEEEQLAHPVQQPDHIEPHQPKRKGIRYMD